VAPWRGFLRVGTGFMISLPRAFNTALVGIPIAPRDLDGPDLTGERVDQDA